MKLLLLFCFVFISIESYCQKTITYEEIKSFTKANQEGSYFDSYLSKDGYLYKIGDTVKLGRPSSNKTFAFIAEGSGAMSILSGQAPTPVTASSSGNNSTIKKIYISGNKRMGFRIYFIGKGICGMCPQYYINVEEAFLVGELKSNGLTREEAISKLKEAKELLELGLMTQIEFDKLKEELSKIIMKQ